MAGEPPGAGLMREFTLKERPLPKWNRSNSGILRRSHRSLAGQTILAAYVEVRCHPQFCSRFRTRILLHRAHPQLPAADAPHEWRMWEPLAVQDLSVFGGRTEEHRSVRCGSPPSDGFRCA